MSNKKNCWQVLVLGNTAQLTLEVCTKNFTRFMPATIPQSVHFCYDPLSAWLKRVVFLHLALLF